MQRAPARGGGSPQYSADPRRGKTTPRQDTFEKGVGQNSLNECREDVETAEEVDEEERAELWHNIASGAASGWDFSSRWFADGQNLSTCRTSMVLPADLNAFLYQV